MTILRLEISNPQFTPYNNQFLTVHSSHTRRRHDVHLYNVASINYNTPIVILMHGVYGSSWVWMHLGGVDKAYQQIKSELGTSEFLLVMPCDGGLFDGSAYLPLSAHENYENWIMQDVIEAVIKSVSEVTENSRIYLCGLSMGGYGALRLGAKYAKQIAGVSAHSSITKLTDLSQFVEEPLSEYRCDDINEDNIEYWLDKNKSELPPIRFDCGIQDSLMPGNIALHEFLEKQKIAHIFESFDGDHQWEYWHEHVKKSFMFFAKIEHEKYI